MQISPLPPTPDLRATFRQLLTAGTGDLPALFPGIPVYEDDEPAEAIAPYIVVDMSLDPTSWGKTDVWGQRINIKLTQPVSIPTDSAISLDYDSSAVEAYERNLEALILGRWPITDIDYDPEDRATYRTLSDWLTLAATDLDLAIRFIDTAQIHSTACNDAGRPVRAKLPLTNDHEIEFDFVIACALEDIN